MATTKAKESCGLGKERKISVTVPNHTPTKRSTPKSSPRAPSTDQKLSSLPFSSSSSAPSLSTHTEKHVPNYLKSTASSRHDHSSSFKPIKKTTTAAPAPIPEGKPSLNRRRSFDKPPPTAPRLDKPFRSPGPRNRAAHVPVRSSSFGAKPSSTTILSSSAKVLERSSSKNSKVGGGGKPLQPLQTMIRSSSNVKKSLRRESSNAAAAAAAASAKNAVEHVDRSPSFVLGMNDEELKKIEYELDPFLPDPMPELDKQLTTDQVEKKAVLDKEEAEAEKKLHHQQQPTNDTEISKLVVSNKEVAETEISIEADAKSPIQEDENRERNQGEGEEEEEAAKEEEKPERTVVEKEDVVAVVTSEENTNNNNEEKMVTDEKTETETDPGVSEGGEGAVVLDQKEAQDGQSFKEENPNSSPAKAETPEKETEATEKMAVAAAEKAAAAAGKPRQGGPGRKESPAMYNHVIEETASKLLEKRKNKVRALAGAFQTVIDYESSSK